MTEPMEGEELEQVGQENEGQEDNIERTQCKTNRELPYEE